MPFVGVVETPLYLRDAERLLSPEERERVVTALAENPLQGDLIKGTHGLRKTRIGFGGRGKRGGGRVIYWYHTDDLPLVLLAVYAKNEKGDLGDQQRQQLVKMAASLAAELGGKA